MVGAAGRWKGHDPRRAGRAPKEVEDESVTWSFFSLVWSSILRVSVTAVLGSLLMHNHSDHEPQVNPRTDIPRCLAECAVASFEVTTAACSGCSSLASRPPSAAATTRTAT